MSEIQPGELIEALPWPAALTGPSGTILCGSRALWSRLGVQAGDWIGRSIEDLDNSLPKGGPRFEAIPLQGSMEQHHWRVLPDDDHEAVQAERMAVIGMLAGGIAHEFNNLMSGLLGYAQLAQATKSVEDYRRAVDAVQETAGRSKDIIGGLLAFAGRHWGQGDTRRLSDIVRPILSMVEAGLRNDNIEIHVDMGADNEGVVDLGRLQQVLLNTIIHSRQAMVGDHGGALRLRARIEENRLTLTLADTHVATPRAAAERPGMGMTINRQIMREVGGGIAVEHSTTGTIYTITCPVDVPAAAPPAPTTIAPAETNRPVGAYKILVVDDEEMVRNLIGHVLKLEGHTVATAHNGYAGVERARHQPPDLAIVDMQMPGMSGIQTCEAIRAEHEDCRFLVITGSVGEEFDELASNLADRRIEVIQKPFQIEMLQSSVHAAMQRDPRVFDGKERAG